MQLSSSVMKRSAPSSLQFIGAAASSSSSTSSSVTAMSARPTFRGNRSRGRNYSNRANGDGGKDSRQFFSVDSHFGQVRDTNRSFRPDNDTNFRNFRHSFSYNKAPPPQSYNRVPPPSYNRVPPPPPPSYNGVPPPQSCNLVPPPESNNLYRPPQHQFSVPPQQLYDQNQKFFRPPRQHFDFNQQFRQPWKNQQQLRPRPPKDLEYRNWQYANPGPPPECERFTILSYNILADTLARDHWDKLYFHIPRHFLDWERRKRSILFELGLWSADVICLQEVDRFQDLKEELELRGYSGIWKMRTGDPVDGCAIFWRNSRFKLLYEESIEFCKVGLRDNVAQICVFESLGQCTNSDTSALTSLHQAKKLVLCNIHVLFNPKRGEIKLGQVRLLLSRAHEISKLWDDAPLILCGDFNSTPKSPLYNFIAEQKLDLSELPRDKVSGQASAEVHAPKPFNPRYGAHSTENSAQAAPAFSNRSQVPEDNASLISQDAPSSVGLVQDMHNNLTLQESCHKDVHSSETMSNASELSSVAEPQCNSIDVPENTGISSLGASTKPPSSHQSFHSLEESLESSRNLLSTLTVDEKSCTSISYGSSVGSDLCESTNSNCQFDEKIESLSLKKELEDTKEGESACEDNLTFLSELHHGSSFPSHSYQFKELDESAKEITTLDSQEFHSLEKENSDDTPSLNGAENTVDKSKYDRSAWTPAEIETATGSPDCIVMEHALKLQSVYGEIQDSLGTRDSAGEPVVTSYHRRFMGTVDYMWRSEGLQAARVLAPIPKHAMLWTKGFPTKKWGSDHIALVSELAFVGHDSIQNSETSGSCP